MGPLATVDFFAKVIAATSAKTDSDHVPLLIQSDPRIPPRPAAILANGPSPLAAMLAGRDRLLAAGATALAMPCNTAHHWYDALATDCPVPFISIIDACVDEASAMAPKGALVGILATRATLAAQIFDDALASKGYTLLAPSEADLQAQVLTAIEAVKAGHAQQAGPLVEAAVERLLAAGASCVILACTELPVALDAVSSPLRERCVDSTAALAKACVRCWQAQAAAELRDSA